MPSRNQFKTNEEYNQYFREYREKNAKKMREYNREYNKEYRKKNGYYNETNSKKRYPEKEHARYLLRQAVRKGLIKRKSCQVCRKKNAQAHHDDYFKPLEVKWFCPLHHSEYHKCNK
jgi:hypothetical protein